MSDLPKYSVLMSVYAKENPEYFRIAMKSMWDQTAPPNEFVLVCDGPLTDGLNEVVRDMEQSHLDRLKVLRLETNQGLGAALNAGLKRCSNDLVARMDADDVSRPERCELQLQQFLHDSDLSLLSGTVQEFSEGIEKVEAERVLPESHEEIMRFARSRNPFNHPCVMYRKRAVEDAGGYQDFYLLEDYYLWIRMLQAGCIGANLREPLLWMRAGAAMYRRRSGLKYARSQARLFKYMHDIGFITQAERIESALTRGVVSLVPNSIRKTAFKVLTRR